MANQPIFDPNARLNLSFGCQVQDENIPDCREYLFGEIFFTQNALWIGFAESGRAFVSSRTYFEKDWSQGLSNKEVYRMTHEYSYRGIKYVMRLDELNFVVGGSRKDVQIRFQDEIDAEHFRHTLSAFQVGRKEVWHRLFDEPDMLSVVSQMIGMSIWQLYKDSQKALQKEVLTYWVNNCRHQDSLGPQVGLEKDLTIAKANYGMMFKVAKIVKQDLKTNIEIMRRKLKDDEVDLETLVRNFKQVYPIGDDTILWTTTEPEVRFFKVPIINTCGTHSIACLSKLNELNERIEIVKKDVKVEEDYYDETDADSFDWTKSY